MKRIDSENGQNIQEYNRRGYRMSKCNQNKYDVGGLHPLRLIPGRVLHKRAENLTTRLNKSSDY